jgi:hypothetical protein
MAKFLSPGTFEKLAKDVAKHDEKLEKSQRAWKHGRGIMQGLLEGVRGGSALLETESKMMRFPEIPELHAFDRWGPGYEPNAMLPETERRVKRKASEMNMKVTPEACELLSHGLQEHLLQAVRGLRKISSKRFDDGQAWLPEHNRVFSRPNKVVEHLRGRAKTHAEALERRSAQVAAQVASAAVRKPRANKKDDDAQKEHERQVEAEEAKIRGMSSSSSSSALEGMGMGADPFKVAARSQEVDSYEAELMGGSVLGVPAERKVAGAGANGDWQTKRFVVEKLSIEDVVTWLEGQRFFRQSHSGVLLTSHLGMNLGEQEKLKQGAATVAKSRRRGKRSRRDR